MPNEWSPAKKWWMDLLKSCITFALAVLASIFLLNSIDDSRSKALFKSQKIFEYKLSALKNFEIDSLEYAQGGEKALLLLLEKELDKDNALNLFKYSTPEAISVRVSIKNLRDAYGDNSTMITLIDDYEVFLEEIERLFEAVVAWKAATHKPQDIQDKDSNGMLPLPFIPLDWPAWVEGFDDKLKDFNRKRSEIKTTAWQDLLD